MITLTNAGARSTLDILGSDAPMDAGLSPSFQSPWMTMQADAEKAQRERRASQLEKLDAALLDPESFFKKNPFEPQFTTDADKAKRRVLVSAALRVENGGKPIPMGADGHELMRRRVAAARFQGRGAEDDDAFHAELVKDATRRKDGKDLGRELARSAFEDAQMPATSAGGFKAFREAVKMHPGYDPTREADYWEQWTATRLNAAETIAEFKPALDAVWNAFETEGDVGKAAREAYSAIPDHADRMRFMTALRLRAEKLAPEAQPRFWSNFGKQSERDITAFVRDAATGLLDSGLSRDYRAFAPAGVAVPNPEGMTSSETSKAIERARAEHRMRADFLADVRNVQESTFDPVKYLAPDGSWTQAFERGAYGSLGAVVTSLVAAVPEAGMATFYASSRESIYQQYRRDFEASGMDYETASKTADAIAPVAALPQVLMERLQVKAFAGKLPMLESVMQKAAGKFTSRTGQFLLRAGAIAIEEGMLEKAQDLVPAFVQDVAHGLQADIPDVNWSDGQNGVLDGFWKDSAALVVTMLPLAIFGAGRGVIRDQQRINAVQAASDQELLALGAKPADISSVRMAGNFAVQAQAVETMVGNLDPQGETAKAATDELKAQRASQARAADTAKASGWIPDIIQTASGEYAVLDGETKEEVGTAPDIGGALRIATAHSAALDDRRADKIAYIATTLEAGEQALEMAADPNAKNSLELGTLYTEVMAMAEGPESIDQFRMQVENREMVDGGDGEVTRVALGRNVPEVRGLVRTFTNRLFRGASVLTMVHETGHGMYQRSRNAGVISREETIQFVRGVDGIMKSGVMKRGVMKGEKLSLLPEGITDEQITEDMLEEAVQEILEAELLRTRKRGKDEKALRFSSGIISRNLLALSRLAPGATRKFRALIEAARGVLGLASARALKMKQAIREGTLDASNHEAFLAKMTGRDWQAEHDGIMRDEHAAITGQTAAEVTGNAPFSLAPARMVESLELNAAARIKDPEVKAKIFENLISKIGRLKRDRDEIKTAFGKEYERKAIAEPRGVANIRKDYALRKEAAREKLEKESGVLIPEAIQAEKSRLVDLRTEELQEQAYARHEGILSNPELLKLKEWPVHAHLADPDSPLRGRLKSKSSAMREVWFSDKVGEFDGADGVPRSNFGGSLMPDQAAQELYEAGLIKEPTPDALWNALKQEAAQIPKFKEAMKAAKADLAAAKEQAKAEAETWARGERIKRQELDEAIQAAEAEIDADMQAALKTEAENYSPRERLLRALAMWDAMLSVLPAEVRGKVGGYVKLAKLSSDEARLKFLEEGIEKIEDALDEFLGKEYRKMLDKLVDDAAPKKDKAGKKRKGHLGAEGHRFFTHVRAVLDMDEDALTVALKNVDDKLMEETDSELLADLSEEWQILRTFGNYDAKHVLEKHDALEMAKKVFKDGKNMWRTLEETRIAAVRAAAVAAKIEAGNGDVRDIQKAKAEGRTALAALTEKHWSLRSFREVLDLAFGEDSATAQRFGNGARKAFAARTKGMIQLQRRWKDAMEKATGKKGRAARQVVYDMQTVQSIDELVSPEIFDEIKIPIDTFFDSEKKSTLGLSKEESAQLTEQFENLPPDSQKKYLTLKRQVKTGEGEARMVKFTEAEAVHLSMLWAQTEYKDAMRKHGFGADFQAAIESKLSPAAKELRQWLADYYRDDFPAIASLYRRMYGVDLRQTENYAPGTFWHTGTNETPVDPSAGVVTGGAFKQGMGSGGDFAQGFLRQRKKHKAVPRIKNAFDLFFSHANQTEHWKALAELSREMHGVFGNPSVKIAMEARSPAAANALREWLNAIDGNGVAMSPSGKLMKYLLESQAYMAMAWKATTAAKNAIGAAVNVAYGMPLHEYVRGMARLVGGRLEFGEVLKSEIIQNKLHGGYAPEVRAAVSQALSGKPTWRGDVLIQGLEIHGKADAFGNAIGATIAFDYHFRKGINAGMSEKQARTVAMELTEDSIARLSQPAEIIDRSLFELNLGTFGKLMFLFASEARQKSSLYMTALGHTVTGKATRKDLRVLFISHLVMAPLMQVVAKALQDAMDPDDDEWLDDKYWNPRDYLMAALTGPFSGIPLMRDIFSGFTGSNSPLGNYVRGGKSLWDLFAEEPRGDEMEWYQSKINQVLHGIGAFPGVAGNVIKQITGTARNVTKQ